mgnify:CR=1 FL=1
MMNIWISHILFSFLPFFNDLVPNITYSGFHSHSILNTGVPVAFTCLTVHIRECCAMDMIGTIWDRLCEDHLYIGLTLSVLKE